jgi:myo-inositol-1(or 4)-monophosphatase
VGPMSDSPTTPAERSHFLATAVRAAQAAARLHQFYAGGDLEIATKSTHTDLVTKVDKLAEAKIREIILDAYPDHAVLGEEEGQPGGDAPCRWIVDPLDGTLNYAHGFPFYCVSVALEVRGTVEVGVVLDSVRGELFTATRGGGAFVSGAPIRVSRETELRRAMLATGFAYHPDTLSENIAVFGRVHPEVRSVRRPGAAALDLCCVAAGRLDGFWELGLNAWDVAAGMLIIREAGGTVTNEAGAPYRLGDKVTVASNGHLHAKLVALLGLAETLA